MARIKLSASDTFFAWVCSADLGEVMAQYRRIGAVIAARRREAQPRRKAKKANGGVVVGGQQAGAVITD